MPVNSPSEKNASATPMPNGMNTSTIMPSIAGNT